MTIGKNIYNLRINHNMTQKELGNIAGVSEKTVSAWENERIIPRMGAIQKMADYFGIKKSNIIESVPINLNADTERVIQNKAFLSEDEKQLVDNYRVLTTDGKTMILTMLKSLCVTHSAAV